MEGNENYKRQLIKRTYKYSLDIIKSLDSLKYTSTNKILSDQLLRSATSVGANICEAQAASSKRDFINFLNHSLKSANESKYWLGLFIDSKRLPEEEARALLIETVELGKILGSTIATLKGKRKF